MEWAHCAADSSHRLLTELTDEGDSEADGKFNQTTRNTTI